MSLAPLAVQAYQTRTSAPIPGCAVSSQIFMPRTQVIAPDRVNDLRAREHLARMAHQVLQQGKLFGRQLDDAPGAACLVPHKIKRQIADTELEGLIKATVAAAQESVDTRQ